MDYSGTCSVCKRQINAELDLEPDLTPPAVIGIFCPCRPHQVNVVLTLRTS